jgi:hypothetical protein
MKNFKIKNRIKYFLYTLLVAVLMVGCTKNSKTKDKNHPAFREAMSKYKIIEVEGCEYILFYGSNSELRYDGVTHKGNCKNH